MRLETSDLEQGPWAKSILLSVFKKTHTHTHTAVLLAQGHIHLFT